jgi:hypothetical protein
MGFEHEGERVVRHEAEPEGRFVKLPRARRVGRGDEGDDVL